MSTKIQVKVKFSIMYLCTTDIILTMLSTFNQLVYHKTKQNVAKSGLKKNCLSKDR